MSGDAGFRLLCNLLFPDAPRSQECCARLLSLIAEKGYAGVPRVGICYYVKRKLIRHGVIREETRFFCDGSRRRKVLVANIEALWRLYQLLSSLKPPPGCLTEEPVRLDEER